MQKPSTQRRLLCVSYHCLFDPGSGAAISAREMLTLLGQQGWHCRTFSGPKLDGADTAPDFAAHLGCYGLVNLERTPVAPDSSLYRFRHADQQHAVYAPADPRAAPVSLAVVLPFLRRLRQEIEQERPDMVITYGGGWIGRTIVSLAKTMGCRVVFWLRNCSYENPAFFAPVDGVIVPCEFSQNWYRARLNLDAVVLPSPVLPQRAHCQNREPRYLTFVNPQPTKGVFFFTGIVEQLAASRTFAGQAAIPVLIVAGRGGTRSLDEALPRWREIPTITFLPATADPRTFYALTRLLVMPSLWDETFSRTPVEAMLNGIPVLLSRRGGLAENARDAGLLLDIPPRWTSETRGQPSEAETAPWREAIERLWDHDDVYAAESARSLQAFETFAPDRLAPRYAAVMETFLACPPKPLRGTTDELFRLLEARLMQEPKPTA